MFGQLTHCFLWHSANQLSVCPSIWTPLLLPGGGERELFLTAKYFTIMTLVSGGLIQMDMRAVGLFSDELFHR